MKIKKYAFVITASLIVLPLVYAQSGESKVVSRIHSLINLANGKSFGVDKQTLLYVNGQKIANPDPADVKVGDLCSFRQGSRMSADEVNCKR